MASPHYEHDFIEGEAFCPLASMCRDRELFDVGVETPTIQALHHLRHGPYSYGLETVRILKHNHLRYLPPLNFKVC